MSSCEKRIEDVGVSDLERHPIWRYREDADGNAVASPVLHMPVSDLGSCLIGARSELAGGACVWVMLGNVTLNNPVRTEQFLGARFERDGEWFELARYFDADYEDRGPVQLSQFLGLSLDEIFPVRYDLSRFVVGHPSVVRGVIEKEPQVRLSQDEIIRLCIEC